MGWFKSKKEEKECYIDKRIIDASNLSDDKLKKEIYLKKFNLIELKEEIKSSITSILITILLTSTTIVMSWVTLYNSISSNVMKVNEISINLKEKLEDEEKKEVVDTYAEMMKGNLDLMVRVINIGCIFIVMSLGYALYDKFSKIGKVKKLE